MRHVGLAVWMQRHPVDAETPCKSISLTGAAGVSGVPCSCSRNGTKRDVVCACTGMCTSEVVEGRCLAA